MAVEQGAGAGVESGEAASPRWLRVKVVDHAREGDPAVNIKMPIGLVKWGIKMAQTFSPEMKNVDLDWAAITAAIDQGTPGKLIEVEDEAEHKTVDVWVE